MCGAQRRRGLSSQPASGGVGDSISECEEEIGGRDMVLDQDTRNGSEEMMMARR